jgi:hypothetical protein
MKYIVQYHSQRGNEVFESETYDDLATAMAESGIYVGPSQSVIVTVTDSDGRQHYSSAAD